MAERSVVAGSEGRSAYKRRAIVEAATALFLREGYGGTSVDQIAADAAVSKQTVYKHFGDKAQLFRAIVLRVTSHAESIVSEMSAVLYDEAVTTTDTLRAALTSLARRYLDGVLQPSVLALRRLVIAEAERFPDLADIYYRQTVSRAIDVIADALSTFEARGLLTVQDSHLAAGHFAYLVLAIPQDRAYFAPRRRTSAAERDRLAAEAVRVFLAAYRR
ncbi:MAG TPA: TetR/AcrR family transcriptional regulator [Mycobacteriales bacterium]|nr:TetR/AcrR family transcriptional regulator [Mycobacteriales bacterium]